MSDDIDLSQVKWDDEQGDVSNDVSQANDIVPDDVQWDEPEQLYSVSDRLESMGSASVDAPESVAKWKDLSSRAGVSYDVAKAIPDQVEKKLKKPDWQTMVTSAPKTSQYLADNPRDFEIAKDDVEPLQELETFRAELKKRGLPDVTQPQYQESPTAALNRELFSNSDVTNGTIENTANPDGALRFGDSPGEFIDNAGRVASTVTGALGTQFGASLDKISAAYDELTNRMDIVGFDDEAMRAAQSAENMRRIRAANAASEAATPTFDTNTARWLFGGVSSLVQTAPTLAVGAFNPLLGITMAGIQSGLGQSADVLERGGSTQDALIAGGAVGLIEGLTEKLPLGFVAENLGKMGVVDFAKKLLSRDMIGEQVATHTQDFVDAVYDPDKTMDQYLSERPEAAIQTVFGVGVNAAAMSGVQAVANRITKFDASKKETERDLADLDKQIDILQKTKTARLDRDVATNILNNMDDGDENDVYVDSALFHTGVVTKDVFLKAAPSAADQIDQAMETGGLIRVPRNELLVGVSQNADIRNDVMAHVKSDVFGDTQSELVARQSELDKELEEVANKAISMAKDKEKAADDFKEAADHIASQLDATGEGTKKGNKTRAILLASRASVIAYNNGMKPLEVVNKYMGKFRFDPKNETLPKQDGGVFNQGGDYNENNAPDSLSDDAADALVELYQELGSNDDVFQYSRDDTKELDDSVLSAAPEGTKQIADDLVIEMAKEDAENAGQPAIVDVKKYVVPTKEVIVDANNKPILKDGKKQYKEHKRDAYVYVNELGEYWVDLSNLKRAGGVGGMIYTKVADFAAKNGGVFRGDPMGLSDDALLKRTEHMASGIARRKQSASFVPHDRQLNPYDEKHKNSPLNKHVRPIQWTNGNDTMNRREIVKTAFHNITQVMPELRHAWIDPDTGRILQRGSPISAKFNDWVSDLQKKEADQQGSVLEKQGAPLSAYRHLYASASIKRQLLANTIARYVGEGGQGRRQLLDKLGERFKDLEDQDDRKLFYQSKNAKPFDGKESDRARIAKRDAEYMAAVERGDMEAAQKLVNEAAAEAGYDPSTSERMSHAAPNSTDGMSVNLADAVTRDEDGNIVPLSKRFNPRKEEEYFQDKDSPRGFFDPSTRDITMLAKADLSTFLHETGHLFLEIQAELALDENASERMKSDMDSVLKWFGVEGETAQDRLKNWHAMPFEQKRPLHEKYAESFEQYLFEGKAPSEELNEAFQTFKAWLSHVYTSIKNFLSESGQNADLNDEIRSVFDRMLATEEQIAQAQQTAGMMPMYASRPGGVSDAEWEAYQQAADEYVQAATEQLSGRALRDLKWVKNAVGTKGKIMREMRREAAALRREARMEARTRFLSRPIVQAYQFLTAPVEGVKARNKRARNSEHVDTARDSLFTAIAKLGGLNKAEAESTYGLDPKAFLRKGGVFGKPVLRKEGGMSLDAMSEALSQYNYLPLDEHGKWGIHDLGDLLLEEAAGNPQYSTDVDMDVLLGEPQRAFFDAENVEYMGGRLNRIDIRNMFDDIQLAEMAGIDPFSGEKVADSAVLQGYNQKRKVEGGGNERQYVLFDEPGNDNAADKKRARRKGAPRNMESAERVPGRYTTTVKSEKTKEINAGFDLLDTPAKVAFATSSLSKSPQEVLFAVATDKNDKPIAILRHSLGMRDSASVDPGIVAGWAANVEGAANLWLSHNHPSGKSDLSNADKNISKIIGDILDGTGITNRGIIAVTHEGNYSWADTSGSDEAGSIPEPEKNKKVSVVEREFSSNGLLSDDYSDGVNNPADAIKMAKDIGGGEAGIVMLDARYRPIGFMPINYTEANNARGKKLHKDIVRAIELSNANTVLHYSPDSGRAVEDGMLNIGALMDVANIKTIDAIVGGNTSLAGRDGILSSNTFQQNKKKKNKDPNAHRTLESMGVLSDDGILPELVAGYFGMETEQLIRGLLDTPELGNIKQAIENMTDQIMLERHADLATPEAIAEATLKAVMNKARAKFVATEYAILAKATGSEMVLQRQAKDYAGRVIGATKVKDVKPEKFIAAAAKAGKEAQKAMAKSDTKAALLAKRNQVLNEATAKLAVDVKEEIDKFDDLAAKIIKATNEKNAKRGRDPDVVNAITAVMGFYGFYPSRQQNAMEYLERVREHDPDMFLRLQDAVNRAAVNQKDFNDLTINEMRGLREEIEGLWYTAKRSRQMEIDGKKIDLQEAADGLVTRLLEVGLPDEKLGAKNAPTEKDLLTHKLKTAGAWLTRVEQWAERMDGQWGGAFTRYIFQPVKKAADRYRTEATEYNRRYVALIDALPKMKRGLIAAPELGYTFGAGDQKVGMAELLHAVLHTGNASNKRKLLLGRGWAVLREDGTLDTARWDVFVERMHKQGVLKKEHYDFAQGVWDLLEDTKAGAQKTHRDVFGYYFAEVTADAFDTPFGSYRGGYVPAQADPRLVVDAAQRAMAEEENNTLVNAFPATAKGFTKGRTEYNKPLMLDLQSLAQHINKVLLFTHMEPAVRDVKKLLMRNDVAETLGAVDRAAYDSMLTPWLSVAARQSVNTPVTGDAGISNAVNIARNNTGMALMAANLSNAMQQITGFLTATQKVKGKYILRETASFLARPKEYANEVRAASEYMAVRMDAEIHAINSQLNELLIAPTAYQKTKAFAARHAYFLQAMMDNTMSPIIWRATFNQSVEKGMTDADAEQYANATIRQTQGSSLPEDVSRVEVGGAFWRATMQFYGYFNSMVNTNVVAVKNAKTKSEAMGHIIYGAILPAIVAQSIAVAMRGGVDDDDYDGWLDDWITEVAGTGLFRYATAMVPVVGAFANLAVGYTTKTPVDDRMQTSATTSMIGSALRAVDSVPDAITGDGKPSKAIKDVAAGISLFTGLPVFALARPVGYAADVAAGEVVPTSGGDMTRGLLTGTASPDSK